MKIGVLQADSVVEQFQPTHGNYPEMFTQMLSRAAETLGVEVDVRIYDVKHGEYPLELEECDGYVITGSKDSVYDDEPWIHQLSEFVQLLATKHKKTVGICFGHQLIAHVLGGKTESAEQGWGVGIHLSEVASPPWFMGDANPQYGLIVSHKDQVIELPENAERLAGSEFCPNSMFMIGDEMLAIQGHPEFSREYAADLMTWRKEILGEAVYRKGIESLEQTLDRDQVAQWIVRFIIGNNAS